MRLQLVTLLLLLGNIATLFSQNDFNYGKLTTAEKDYEFYEKDSTVHAVVLYERGDNYFEIINNHIRVIKEYHVKIKILDEKGFVQGKVSIPFYHNERTSEKITEIKAKTHNEISSHSVLPNQFFENDLSEKWSEMVFTFPKLQKGSIVEYYYKLTSPFIYNFNGWEFQASIPKLYSEFNATIPGYYIYNRNLNGSLKLHTNVASIKKNCFNIPGSLNQADCEVLKYVMKDIPAFEAEEDYMLAASNYISRIDFELSQLTRINGAVEKYTKTWKDVDKEFKSDKDIGKQLSKKNFFQKSVPASLLSEGNELERAKNIFEFIKDHYTWNEKFGIFRKARVKQAFENKAGNVAEINMSLVNLLNAAGIETKLMLSSTRQQGLPKTSHPVMSDFNYFLAYTTIEGNEYLLDATDKFMPFGMLPFRALNHYGRVMNFKEESYWSKIEPQKSNTFLIRGQIMFDPEENQAQGTFYLSNSGYNAVNTRKNNSRLNEDEYIEKLETLFDEEYNITSHDILEEKSNDKVITERINLELDNLLVGEMIYINPFFTKFFSQNPFKLEERNYPVDFGYPRNYKYQLSIEVPDGYSIHELPQNKMVKLGDKIGYLRYNVNQESNTILINYDFNLQEVFFTAENYKALKEIFKYSIDIQKNSLVILKKV